MAEKEHKYDHHPVRIVEGLALGDEQEWGGIIDIDVWTSPIFELENSSTTGWLLYSLDASEDYTPPRDAIAVILDVAARDAAGGLTDAYVSIATPGILYGSKTQIVYCGDVNDRWQSRLVIAELNDKYEMAVKVTASVAGLDFAMKLIGWLIDPSVTKPSPPSEDLKGIFVVP